MSQRTKKTAATNRGKYNRTRHRRRTARAAVLRRLSPLQLSLRWRQLLHFLRASFTFSPACLRLAFRWSALPSDFRLSSPLASPTTSLSFPFAFCFAFFTLSVFAMSGSFHESIWPTARVGGRSPSQLMCSSVRVVVVPCGLLTVV